MLTFPVPMFGACVLLFLALRTVTGQDRHPGLVVFLLLCALQSLVLALNQHYQVGFANALQPITAALIPAVAWCAMVASAQRRLRIPFDLVHSAGPVLALLASLFLSEALDTLVPALFFGYGLAIVFTARDNGGALLKVHLDSGGLPYRMWRAVGYLLIVSALSDVLIVLVQIAGLAHWQPILISVFSSALLIALGLLSLSDAVGATANEDASIKPSAAEPAESAELAELADLADTKEPAALAEPVERSETIQSADDKKTVAMLQEYLNQSQLFLEPDLNLARLARKLSIPAKQLSAAVNRETGENVSRNINRFRIEHACAMMDSGSNVTTAIHASGFNTKSNFNREFNRVKNMTPSAWLERSTGRRC